MGAGRPQTPRRPALAGETGKSDALEPRLVYTAAAVLPGPPARFTHVGGGIRGAPDVWGSGEGAVLEMHGIWVRVSVTLRLSELFLATLVRGPSGSSVPALPPSPLNCDVRAQDRGPALA